MIISDASTPYWSPQSDEVYSQSPEITSNKRQNSDLHMTVRSFTYCLVLVVAVEVVAFISIAAIGNGDSSSDDVDDEAVRGIRIRTGPAARIAHNTKISSGKTARRSRKTTPVKGGRVVAKLINASLDWNYSPCDDFYKFVCNRLKDRDSRWMQTEKTRTTIKAILTSTKIPPREQRATEKAAGLYQACVRLGSSSSNTELDSVKDFLSNLGLDMADMKSDPHFDIPQRIAQLALEYGFPTFVKFDYHKEPRTTNKILEMHLNSEDEEWIVTQHKDNSDEELEDSYSSELDFYGECLKSASLAKRIIVAESIVKEFLPAIREHSSLPIWTTVRNIGRFTNGTVSEARWEEVITEYTGHLFEAEDTVTIWDNATGLVQLLMDASYLCRDDSRLLVAWTLLRKLLPFASGEKMVSLAVKKYGRQEEAITDFCYDTVFDIMALAASKRYFRKFVPRSARESARRITTDVIEVLKMKINGTDWIQGDARRVMFDKAKHLQIILGFPDDLAASSRMEAFYSDHPDVGDNFFESYLEAHRMMTNLKLYDKFIANFKPTDTNAVYNREEHNMVIFAGLLQPPFFINDGAPAMNYGGLGQVLGQTIMHAYDAAGMTTDYLNRKVDLQVSPTMTQYAEKVTCLRSSYEKVDRTSRARMMQDVADSEAVVDFGGIELAYSAYRRLSKRERRACVPGLTGDQAFFVSHCLKWCSEAKEPQNLPRERYWRRRSRCIVPLQNFPRFADVFACNEGDFMNPKNRCQFW